MAKDSNPLEDWNANTQRTLEQTMVIVKAETERTIVKADPGWCVVYVDLGV